MVIGVGVSNFLKAIEDTFPNNNIGALWGCGIKNVNPLCGKIEYQHAIWTSSVKQIKNIARHLLKYRKVNHRKLTSTMFFKNQTRSTL
jgi:hypothetical protein